MEQCSRCGRYHTGICGIPGVAVRIGMGGNGHRRFVPESRRPSTSPDSWHIEDSVARVASRRPRRIDGKPAKPAKIRLGEATKSRSTCPSLQRLLDWGLDEERKCLEMLKALPPEMEEYTLLMEKLDSLQHANHQIRLQLAQRK